MRREQKKSRSFITYFLVLFLFALILVSFSKRSFAMSCFPTCSSVDGRLLAVVESAGFETLTGDTLNVRLVVPGTADNFTIGIFDGDADVANANWDNGGGNPLYTYTVIPDPDQDNMGPPVFEALSTALPNNDWMDFTLPNNPLAQNADGDFVYTVRIRHQDPVDGANGFKLRSSGLLK
jgi:hypothetical protein